MRIFKMIDRLLLRHWPRYRLWRICKAIGIKPYEWQRSFVLRMGFFLTPGIRFQRANGKTTAIMLRILMIPKNNADAWAEAGRLIQLDPDWDHDRLRWYSGEYRRLRNLCLNAGIPVLRVEIYRMIEECNRRIR